MADSAELLEVAQVAIPVKDVAAALEFYRDRLGLPLLFEAPGMAFFQCGSVRLMLTVPESDEFDHPSSILYFRVEDIDAAHEALRGRGVEFRREPFKVHASEQSELWMAFFADVAGNTMALSCEKPVAA